MRLFFRSMLVLASAVFSSLTAQPWSALPPNAHTVNPSTLAVAIQPQIFKKHTCGRPGIACLQLEARGSSESRLLADATVKSRTSGLWEHYRTYVRLGVAVLSVESGLIAILATHIRRRKRYDLAIRQLTRKLIETTEDERRHIARELHDDIGQRLSLVSVQLDSLNHRNPAGPTGEPGELKDSLRDLDALISDVHDLSHRLHSSKLEHLGLGVALKQMCQQVSRQGDLQIDLQMDGVSADLDRDVTLCFYRVAQEALNNVVKHSSASQVQVRVMIDRGQLRMLVQDFGNGFNTEAAAIGLGLLTMEERLRMVSGKLSVVSKPGEGTIVTAVAPCFFNNNAPRNNGHS